MFAWVGTALGEWHSQGTGGNHRTAETMAARRANSRREMELLLLPFMKAPVPENGYLKSKEGNYPISFQRQLYESTRQTNGSRRCSDLIHACKRLDLELQRLRVLPLDLHLSLQFLDEKIEPSDF